MAAGDFDNSTLPLILEMQFLLHLSETYIYPIYNIELLSMAEARGYCLTTYCTAVDCKYDYAIIFLMLERSHAE